MMSRWTHRESVWNRAEGHWTAACSRVKHAETETSKCQINTGIDKQTKSKVRIYSTDLDVWDPNSKFQPVKDLLCLIQGSGFKVNESQSRIWFTEHKVREASPRIQNTGFGARNPLLHFRAGFEIQFFGLFSVECLWNSEQWGFCSCIWMIWSKCLSC